MENVARGRSFPFSHFHFFAVINLTSLNLGNFEREKTGNTQQALKLILNFSLFSISSSSPLDIKSLPKSGNSKCIFHFAA